MVHFEFDLKALPEVTRAGRHPLDDRHFEVNYLNSSTHALHIYDYSGKIRLSGTEHAIAPGTLTITPMGVDARYDLPRPGFHYCTHFNFSKSRTGKTGCLSLPLHMNLGEFKSAAESRFLNLIWWVQQAGSAPETASAASLILQEFLLWLHWIIKTREENPGHKAMTAVVRAAIHIDEHLSRPLCIPEISRGVGLSQNYLATLFRKQYGMTMNHYLIQRRIEYAKHLLTCTALPVKEVGVRVGIPDPQHFNKIFRKITRRSPSAFRGKG